MSEEKCKKCKKCKHNKSEEGDWFEYCEACIFEECRQVENNFNQKRKDR